MARVWTRNRAGTQRLAPCLVALFDQADARWPARSTASDGSLGDQAHAARKSDHNPGDRGIVHAADLTDDIPHGVDAHAIAQHLLDTRDPRVLYVISEGGAFYSYARSGHPAWRWVKYTGSNPHTKHVHVSIVSTPAAENDLRPWFPPQEGNSNAPPQQEDDDMGVIYKLKGVPYDEWWLVASDGFKRRKVTSDQRKDLLYSHHAKDGGEASDVFISRIPE